MTGGGPYALGVDSGGSGLRVALCAVEPDGAQGSDGPVPVAPQVRTGPVRTGPGGIDAAHLLELVLPAVETLLHRAEAPGTAPSGEVGAAGGRIAAAVVGAAGMATLGGRLRAVLPGALTAALGPHRLALAADGVTAYAGALGMRPGAVVAAGTGMIALGTDLSRWHRADGWGHLLGDAGGGAWIGRQGLDAALRAHDGRRGGSPALLERVRAVFGAPAELPGLLYPRADRPAFLASFAPEVAACAAADPVSAGILRDAGRHIAEAAAAVCPAPDAADGREEDRPRVAWTGGLFSMGEPLLVPLREELAALAPHAVPVPPDGDPLAGALRLARALARDEVRLPSDPALLTVAEPG
ncbi:N-acetylglucosamine kinase [uncultured Streptomyces sp.]|uniref:N-acetylglucosamine kinase n=1 Tax=uncultured Streptomyces sp. TaxID=174707 RepID=UPI002620F0F5|nr:BadF/BadG/BcrA/BcrD ATPase family protein [uncultured Streptomyces sp.]